MAVQARNFWFNGCVKFGSRKSGHRLQKCHAGRGRETQWEISVAGTRQGVGGSGMEVETNEYLIKGV
jgi:hypothetical protein